MKTDDSALSFFMQVAKLSPPNDANNIIILAIHAVFLVSKDTLT